MKKVLYLAVLAVTMFAAIAQAQEKMADKGDAMKSNDAMKGGAMKFVSVEDAAKTALNVGAKMPAFTLNDSLGKAVNSKDLLKQGNLV